jgi:hypothetical protein
MSALGVFHVVTYADTSTDPEPERVRVVAGVCAANKTDAAAGVCDRLARDGFAAVIVHDVERLTYSPHGWPAGGVLVYTADDRLPA